MCIQEQILSSSSKLIFLINSNSYLGLTGSPLATALTMVLKLGSSNSALFIAIDLPPSVISSTI